MIMKYKLVLFLLIGFCITRVSAQFTPFAYTYGGNGSETGYGIVESSDSGYVCTGQTGTNSVGSSDAFLFKTDINGELLWKKNIGGVGSEGGNSIANGHGGGYILAGYTNSMGSGGYDFYVIRTNDSGDTLWTRTYGGEDWDLAYSIAPTADGNYLVCGESFQASSGADVWVVKINESGDTIQTWRWADPGNQIARQIKEYEPGKAVLAGFGVFPPATDFDAIVYAFDHQNGSIIFETVQARPGDQKLYGIDSTNSGGFIGFGSNRPEGFGLKEMHIDFYTGAGTFLYSPLLNESGKDKELFFGANFKNQGYYSGGIRADSNSANSEAVFYKLDLAGYVSFGLVIAAPGLNSLQASCIGAQNNVALAGISEGYGPGVSGALIWTFDSLLNTVSTPTVLLDMNEYQTYTPNIDVFPNPFVYELIIHLPETETAESLLITDLSGKCVFTSTENYSGVVTINSSEFSQGVYILQVRLKSGFTYYAKIIRSE